MIKRLLKGNLNDIAQVPITEQDDVEIVDFPEGGITNAQMAAALTAELDGFYSVGSVYICTDNGEYGIKSHLYEFTSNGWVDITMPPAPQEEVIDVGEGQAMVDGTAYPLIDKGVADEIYTKYTSGKRIVLLWTLTGIKTYFSVVYATETAGYEIDCIVHGKVLKYCWTTATEGSITPTI